MYNRSGVHPSSFYNDKYSVCIEMGMLTVIFFFSRSWDKVYTVVHGSSLQVYKDQKHAKSVSHSSDREVQ